MVDFLLQDGVSDILLGFVTQIDTGEARPSPNDSNLERLKLSYRLFVIFLILNWSDLK
jgi:hypothetical protein